MDFPRADRIGSETNHPGEPDHGLQDFVAMSLELASPAAWPFRPTAELGAAPGAGFKMAFRFRTSVSSESYERV